MSKTTSSGKEIVRAVRDAARAKGFSGSAPWFRRVAERAVEFLRIAEGRDGTYIAHLLVARHPAPARAQDAALLGSSRWYDHYQLGGPELAKGGMSQKAIVAQRLKELAAMLAWASRTTRTWPLRSAPLSMEPREVVQRFADAASADLRLPKRTLTRVRLSGPSLTIEVLGRPAFTCRASALHALIAKLYANHPRIDDVIYGLDKEGNNRIETALLCGKLEAACEDLAGLLAEKRADAEARLCLVRAGITVDKLKTELGRRLFRKTPRSVAMDEASSAAGLVGRLLKQIADRSATERIVAACKINMFALEALSDTKGARRTRLLADLQNAIKRLDKDGEPAAKDLGRVMRNVMQRMESLQRRGA